VQDLIRLQIAPLLLQSHFSHAASFSAWGIEKKSSKKSNERSANLYFLAHMAPFGVDGQTKVRYSPASFLNKTKLNTAFNIQGDCDELAPNLIL
jgi:hypothetical protein